MYSKTMKLFKKIADLSLLCFVFLIKIVWLSSVMITQTIHFRSEFYYRNRSDSCPALYCDPYRSIVMLRFVKICHQRHELSPIETKLLPNVRSLT